MRSVDEFGDAAFTGLRRGLDRLSGASQYAVVRQVEALPSKTRRAVANADRTEQLVGFISRQRAAAQGLAESLLPDQFNSLVGTKQRLITDGGLDDPGATVGETLIVRTIRRADLDIDRQDIYKKFESLSESEKNRLGLAVAYADRGAVFVKETDATFLNDLAQLEGAAEFRAVELFDEGVPITRIDELVDNDIDLDLHSQIIQKLARVTDNRKTQDVDDIAEIVAEERLYDRYPANEFEVANNVKIRLKNGQREQIDHVIIRKSDGNVVGIAETKNSVSRNALEEANSQLSDNLNLITSRRDEIAKIATSDSGAIKLSKFRRENIDGEDVLTVGADDKFDVVNADVQDIELIAETFKRYIE